MSFYFDSREWMDQRIDPQSNSVSEVFLGGINAFLQFACNQANYEERQTLLCPCTRCKNVKQRDAKVVSRHLFLYGFKGNYYVWTSHGEKFYTVGESSGANHSTGEEEMWENPTWNAHEDHYQDNLEVPADIAPPYIPADIAPPAETDVAEPYRDNVFEAFEAASQPLYEGCADGISQLSLASRMLKMKTDYNLAETCVDEISEVFKTMLPQPNNAPATYYETKKLTRGLGLPVQKIDVCVKNCMLFWKEDAKLVSCRFCGEDRYYPNNGKGKNKPKQRMLYMPIADRLKRLYQLEATASIMRWHKEHVTPEGEMHHPSDAIAWKHFNEVYPGFAAESRNIYLCLSTDGFNPIGMNGEAHSLWPVIVTPYNLPPGMCMKREFLYLSVLIHGPKHPRKSLDIYLQPLIEELQMLWRDGVEAYDISMKERFKMRAVLMWTISDFPAYGMLSDHPYRKNTQAFRRGKTVLDPPPPWLTGEEILRERINNIEGLSSSVECGGNGHDNPSKIISGYGVTYNWVKKSIFWELPYWENHLLRHSLDFMHIEKNFFDNLTNTLLNAPGKTKDNIKSRLDLPGLCKRWDLEMKEDGTMPVPIFRLPNAGKRAFLLWLKNDIKFPDGYASKFSRYIALFFRDISSKILKESYVGLLKANVGVKLCNLEKIFLPSFFDVMEHLLVHLPDEVALGGPVHFRWMYVFERYMYHLKQMVKNKAHIAGSIVAQWINEEISNASSNFFGHPEIMSIPEGPNDIRFTYNYPDVPPLFYHEGRISGQCSTGWLNDEDNTILQTFMMLNCETFAPYERMFEEYMTLNVPDITPVAMQKAKDTKFADWCKDYINDATQFYTFPIWMLDFVQGPRRSYRSWPIYHTRGYTFHTHNHGQNKRTQHYGVCVPGTNETDYYGLVQEIMMVEYHGDVGLKVMVFKCSWFDKTTNRGMRIHPFGLVDVSPRRQYAKYDPFVLPGNCDQACFISYPRVRRQSVDDWWACAKIIPRGICETPEIALTAWQDDRRDQVAESSLLRVETHVVDDVSDYDIAPVNPPNDEYVSDGDVEADRDSDDDSE
ncbi:uncharacterized protein LOC103829553 [Brassica rapa]|uniref:uncharacterized protein LOC103829553 n=1 Tax=Brassica campestris TaxID=3711 RepID=UPI00142E66D5|nr:uncharacterized protein LOC103829553 [Brassica rapa]XP_048638333.1 uncharacterized protein LOC125610223 [Brassica napus]